jgi:hypothetical protein
MQSVPFHPPFFLLIYIFGGGILHVFHFGGNDDSFKKRGLWCLTPLSTKFQLYRGGKSGIVFFSFLKWVFIAGCMSNRKK